MRHHTGSSARVRLDSAKPMLVVMPIPVVTVTMWTPLMGYARRNSEPAAEL
jgi:hypothetical protein